jgi:periplasmic protein TonB
MSFTAGSQPLRLAADAGFRLPGSGDRGFDRLRYSAVAAAALIHFAVIAALLVGWPFAPTAKPEPPPIPVALVIMPPPALPKPLPKPPPKPAPRHDLVSGPDQQTTAPPAAEAKGLEAAPKPEPKRVPTAALAPAPPKPVSPTPSVRHEPVKEAKRELAPEPRKHVSIDRAPGEKWLEGDPYLNRVQAMIERHRFYPANAIGPLGLRLQGVAVYAFMVSPAGTIKAIRLERSSGSQVLDDAARAMIERAAPFPPLPRDFPQDGAVFTVAIPLFPTSS